MRHPYPIIVLAVLIAASSVVVLSDQPDSEADSTYRTPDSTYSYTTHGSGSESSPYYSVLYGVVSSESTLFIQSALEGYCLTTIASMGGCLSETVIIPGTVTAISGSAFDGCAGLRHIVFLGDRPDWSAPSGVSVSVLSGSSGWTASDGANTLQVMSAAGGASYFVLDGRAVVVGGSGADIVIPDEDGAGNPFTVIAPESFRDTGIESVAMGRNITDVGTRAFYGCTQLRSASISESIERIGDEAFRYCISLGDVDLHSVTELGFESFRDCRSFGSIEIPDSVGFVGGGAFYLCRGAVSIDIASLSVLPERMFGYCTSLESIDLSGVREIGLSAFNTCRSLENVTFGDPEVIGDYAFDGCELLCSPDLGGSLLSIGKCAFSRCLSITEIRFPESFASMGDRAFFHANSLKDIYFEGDMPDMPDEPFPGLTDLRVHVERSHLSSWNGYGGELTVEGAEDGSGLPAGAVAAIAVAAAACIAIIAVILRRGRAE